MFELHDVVILKRTIPKIPVQAGARGTIVHVHPEDPLGYLVEFPDALGANGLDANGEETLGVYPAHARDLEKYDNSWKMPRNVARAETYEGPFIMSRSKDISLY